MFLPALLAAGLVASSPATTDSVARPTEPEPATVPVRTPRRKAPKAPKPPWDWRFVGAHYGTGVIASLLVLPGSYGFAGWIGHRGKGLGPVVGALLVGAFLPPIVTYTTQWAVGRKVAPGRDRFWPGYLVNQAGHLAVFVGAVLGGADFRVFADVAPVVLTDAFVVTGLGTLTAEATRRPRLRPLETPELSWQRADRLWGSRRRSIVVPLLEVPLP